MFEMAARQRGLRWGWPVDAPVDRVYKRARSCIAVKPREGRWFRREGKSRDDESRAASVAADGVAFFVDREISFQLGY
jgi:hypothetical protein